jgi:protein-disulfide isomerase
LTAALGFAAAAVAAILLFPSQPVSAESASPTADASAPLQALPVPPPPPDAQVKELETWLSRQGREPLVAAAGNASVVLVKFNDYQCPPCRQTYMQYKPILAKYEQSNPGKVRLVTRDYPLDPECNAFAPGGQHTSACEAAVAVRLAKDQGKAEAMEEWLFGNQPTLSPQAVKDAARTVGGVPDFDAKYPNTLTLVRADIAQGGTLEVKGTPTFFMNGIRLPNLQPQFLDVAIAWELKRIASGAGR